MKMYAADDAGLEPPESVCGIDLGRERCAAGEAIGAQVSGDLCRERGNVFVLDGLHDLVALLHFTGYFFEDVEIHAVHSFI